MNLYRAVSEREYQQLIETSLFEITSQSVEGKYFAETWQDARQWGDLLFGAGQYRVIAVELPDDLCAQFHRWERLDRIGLLVMLKSNSCAMYVYQYERSSNDRLAKGKNLLDTGERGWS